MAKWGEGDPRWIVEERADATNVNNWHWTEKNANQWSKDKLRELIVGCTFENDEFIGKVTSMSKCEGEASANNRKAKLIFFYEWSISGEWEGSLKNSENKTKYKGNYEVTNLSEEYEPREAEVEFTIKDSKQQKLKEFARKQGLSKMRDNFEKYLTQMRDHFGQGLILPTGGAANGQATTPIKSAPAPATTKTTAKPAASQAPSTTSTSSSSESAANIETKKLTLTEEFKCKAADLYQVFVDLNMVRAFTNGGIVTYEPKPGGQFALFDSNISGKFVSLDEKNKKISMLWRNKRWPDEHFSVANMEFQEKSDHTILKLVQTNVPANFVENTQDGWRHFYFNSIRQKFGFGSNLF